MTGLSEEGQAHEIIDGMLGKKLITEKTHARCGALIDGEPDPYPDPKPEPDIIEPSPGCCLSNDQAFRIASSVMETIGTQGAPRGTPVDAARIMGITLGIGRALAPPDQIENFMSAFAQGQAIAAAWAQHRHEAGA